MIPPSAEELAELGFVVGIGDTTDGYRVVELTRGFSALIDVVDEDFVNRFSWCASGGYAHRKATILVQGKPSVRQHIRMHRELAESWGWNISGFEVDHKNRNTYDNRRSNLRIATRTQNCMNRKCHANSESGIKGVGWSKVSQKWRARIMVSGSSVWLGLFETAEAAAAAYANASYRLHGTYGRTE